VTRRPRVACCRLLEVTLDRVGVPYLGVAWILSGLSARPALPQKIPTPVQLDRDLLEALAIVWEPLASVRVGLLPAQERLLLFYERFDPTQERSVIHHTGH
jgi:hypothetical protein